MSEAEHMSEFMDEGYYDDLRFKEEFNNSRIWRRSSKKTNERKSDVYVIIQDSRKDDTTLMLVDRRKSKKYWWTHDISIAYKGSKKEMQKVASRLHKNNARVVEMKDYLSVS